MLVTNTTPAGVTLFATQGTRKGRRTRRYGPHCVCLSVKEETSAIGAVALGQTTSSSRSIT